MHLGVGGLLDSLCLDTHTPKEHNARETRPKKCPVTGDTTQQKRFYRSLTPIKVYAGILVQLHHMKAFLSSENSTETDAKLLPMLYCVALVIFLTPPEHEINQK